MSGETASTVVFYALVALAWGGAAAVAFGRNIVRSAFALLGTFLGVAGLYALLSADLVAVIQLLVYVGGILVLILFAVMLTSRIAQVKASNLSLGLGAGLLGLAAVAVPLVVVLRRLPWSTAPASPATPTTSAIGDALLSTYVLPFEVVSVLLLAALVGAVMLARSRGEERQQQCDERPMECREDEAPGGEGGRR
jgi:NAD(P)H-quinone oxidoreductase subunit 6